MERDIEITQEMIETVAQAQLYREDPLLALRKVITKKLTAKELNQVYKDILRHPKYKETEESELKLEKLTLVNDDTDTIMLIYNKMLREAQQAGKFDVATRILGEIRKLKAIDDAEQKFEVIITVKPTEVDPKTPSDK